MRAFLLKALAVVIALLGAGIWFVVSSFNFQSSAVTNQPAFLADFFVFLGLGYFLALLWAAFVGKRKTFSLSFALAHVILTVEVLAFIWRFDQELRTHSAANLGLNAVYGIFDFAATLSLTFLLPTLAWFLLRAHWYNRDSLVVLRVFALAAGLIGILVWLGLGNMGGARAFFSVDKVDAPICFAFFFFWLGLGYFLVLFWTAFGQLSKGFYIKLLAAQFILATEIFYNLASSFYDVGITREVWFIPLVGNFALRMVLVWLVFFLPSWAWGLLLVARLKPSWFKKVDISPKLG